MKSHIHRRRALAGAILCAGLAGCSSDSNTTWSQIGTAARLVWNRDTSITLQQAAAVPFASMGVRVGDSGPQRLIVLASTTQQGQLWTSAARIALITRSGRVVRSAGFGTDLSATLFAEDDPLEQFERGDTATRQARRFLDFHDLDRYSATLDCTLAAAGSEDIVILGKSIRTRRVNEHCESAVLSWSFDNTFWIGEPSGIVWRSIQHLHPNQDAIETETLRPPSMIR